MKIFQEDCSTGVAVKKQHECPSCKETNPLSFYVDKKGLRTNAYCKECHKENCKKRWRSKTLIERQAGRVNALYGITSEEYIKMHEVQESKCALCGEIPTTKRGLHVDHCHKTGLVRSLLCQHCNVGLGAFKDNVDLLEKAIQYLRKNHERT